MKFVTKETQVFLRMCHRNKIKTFFKNSSQKQKPSQQFVTKTKGLSTICHKNKRPLNNLSQKQKASQQFVTKTKPILWLWQWTKELKWICHKTKCFPSAHYFLLIGFYVTLTQFIGHTAMFQLYWWRKTSDALPCIISGTNGRSSRTTDVP
jgi:hypothetical protein